MKRELCNDCKYYDEDLKCPYKEELNEDEQCYREIIQNTMSKNKLFSLNDYILMIKYSKRDLIQMLKEYIDDYQVTTEWLLYIFSKSMKGLEFYLKDSYLEFDDIDDIYLFNKNKIEKHGYTTFTFRGEDFNKVRYSTTDYVIINFRKNKIIYTFNGITNDLKINFQKLYDRHKIVDQETTNSFMKILNKLKGEI